MGSAGQPTSFLPKPAPFDVAPFARLSGGERLESDRACMASKRRAARRRPRFGPNCNVRELLSRRQLCRLRSLRLGRFGGGLLLALLEAERVAFAGHLAQALHHCAGDRRTMRW